VSTNGHAAPEPPAPGSARARRPGPAWLVPLVAVAIAAVAVGLVVSRVAGPTSGHPVARASLPAGPASYLGVYEPGSPRAYAPVAGFAKTVGKQPNLVGYFSGWAEPFATSFAERVHGHGAVTVVQIDPTGASVQGIAAGAYDGYLRSYADSVRDFGHPVVIGFGHEMNATWYSWGYGHVRPATFVAAWRHIVTVFRNQGANNVTWLWTLQADAPGTGPVRSWWPGPSYVTWVGIDGYYYRPADSFASVFGRTIGQVRRLTRKPVLLSETAVGPGAAQVSKIANLFTGMRRHATLGLVWFDMAQHRGIYHQDWRIEGNPQAAAAVRRGVRSKLMLARLPGR
jgi:mannan endo-1,4-beta-mannosidase